MSPLSPPEASLIEGLDRQSMLDQTITWAEVNSGTANLSGLDRMARLLADAFSALPGELSLVEPDPVEKVGADGKVREVACGQHLVVRVRPEADRRVLLTGHMDTVYAADHGFQSCAWIDERTLHGPGTADMKGGLALMLAGLIAFERSGPTLGYDILINSDEETGSLSSRALIAQLARGKFAALTYEPALPNGNMARARPGSGNFAALATFRSHFSFVQLRIRTGSGAQAMRLLDAGKADLAIVLEEISLPSWFERQPSTRVQLVVVASPDHPLAGMPEPIIPEILAEHLQVVVASRPVDDERDDHGVVAINRWYVTDYPTKHALLLAGLGWGSMPAHLVEEDIFAGRLVRITPQSWDGAASPPELPLVVGTNANRFRGPATRLLSEVLASGK